MRASEECVETKLRWVQEKREQGKRVIMVMMDVAQAFPIVGKGKMLNRLQDMCLGENIIDWVCGLMTKWKIKRRLDGEKGEWREVQLGSRRVVQCPWCCSMCISLRYYATWMK